MDEAKIEYRVAEEGLEVVRREVHGKRYKLDQPVHKQDASH